MKFNNILFENSNCTNENTAISDEENLIKTESDKLENNKLENSKLENHNENDNSWKLEIPKINLIADISEGTNEEILNKYIGHFSETPKENGNVALAAHNRGYKVNYFQNLKELEIGDIVFYTYKETKRKYVIEFKTIIKDTEWKNLENTKENKLTLITCVENQPEYRRCLQAIEIK